MTNLSYLRTPTLLGTGVNGAAANEAEVAAKRQEIADYFNATYNRYLSLFDTLADDQAYYEKPIPLRHPLIFYFGHTATFFINKLVLAGMIEQRVNPEFESMFAIGVDEMSWDDLDETHYDWPTVDAVREYRREVQGVINDLIQNAPLSLPINWQHAWWPILMGIEHEQIHLETSSVLIRQQKLSLLQTSPQWRSCQQTGKAPQNTLLSVSAGEITLGKERDLAGHYGWDNEYGQHTALVDEFKASQYLVSNQQFLEFIEDGGYQKDEYWLPEGLQWRNFSGATKPEFWLQQGSQWMLRLMTEEVPMRWDWPAEVNYHEAKAFCNWLASQTGEAVRLPTEDEWVRLADFTAVKSPVQNEQASANLHLDHGASSCPVNQFAHGDFFDVVGNVWQWTETSIYPFEGFQVHPLYDDFTMPTFDGHHNLFKGGSWISCGNESLLDSRYAFRKHFFQHAGFRYVVAGEPVEQQLSNYETDKMLSEYAEFHFGDNYFDVPNFPVELARIAITAMEGKPANKALDLGCAVGRASLELAHHFDQVTGIDFSARLIDLGVQLIDQGVIRYSIADEGDLLLYKERTLESMGLTPVRDKVDFLQGDACNLKPHLTGYDLVLAANLIDRLYDPALFLADISERVNPGGVLMITSPYTWLEEHTQKENWLGGYKKDGENYTTLDGLKEALGKNFKLMKEPQQVPFVIRETSRKFQHTLADVTLWEKV